MEISLSTPYIHAGENNSRTLKITADSSLTSGKTVRIAFVTPAGKACLSDVLTFTEGSCDYLLPYTLLDCYGKLYAQLNITDSEGYCIKSDIYDFEVHSCIDAQSTEDEADGLITLSQLDLRLEEAEEFIENLQAITVSELQVMLV